MSRTIPPDFLVGTSTAAYQIESARNVDGKSESLWDRFCHTPGKSENGDTGDTACDHFHRVDEDLDLVAKSGAKAYRFSMNWTQILPAGNCEVNSAGLAFYHRIVDGCHARGITHWLGFDHLDYSEVLQGRGG
jgi:beta-glucosidase